MIDFERDIKITPEDIETQNRLRQERRPLSVEEYLDFLSFMHNFFPNQPPQTIPKKTAKDKKFEL